MQRPKTTQSAAGRPPAPQSSQSGVHSFNTVQPLAACERAAVRPDTPAQSFTAPPSTIEPQDEDKIGSSRVKSPRYRDDLKNHGIYIDPYDLRGLSDAVKVLT